MKLKVMAVYDQAAAAFLPPFCVATRAMALRIFEQTMRSQPDHDFVRHSDQYTLYQLASFDNEVGVFSECSPETLGTLQALLTPPKEV